MDTTFYLIRHGKKASGIGDVPLSPEGRREAEATARHLHGRDIARVVHSPLARARETAEAIAAALGTTLSEDSRLRERANWGDLPGQSFEDFHAMCERCITDRRYMPPVGDSAFAAGERFRLCLEELAHRHPGETIIIVAHGGVMTDFLINVIDEARLRQVHPRFIEEQSMIVPECSVTEVRVAGSRFELNDFASVGHLE